MAQSLEALVKLGSANNDISEDFFIVVMKRFFDQMQVPPQGTGNSAMIEIRKQVLAAAQL